MKRKNFTAAYTVTVMITGTSVFADDGFYLRIGLSYAYGKSQAL
jgi:hypothetical protein